MAPPDIKPGPVTRVCHVCGRQYGLSSFDIHLKQCKKLFIAQEELKPKGERRPVPKTPPELDGRGGRHSPGGAGGDDSGGNERPTREMIEAMNRAAQETYNEHGMEKCENCGRTFAEGRLAIHAKSCRPGNAAKRVDESTGPRNKKADTGMENGQVPAMKKSVTRPLAAEKDAQENLAPTRPVTGSSASPGVSRPLAGSLASNRKKIPSQDPTAATAGTLHSPLGAKEVNADALKQELAGNETMVGVIQDKLNHWEATTLATLQEIRDLKQLFTQLSPA